MPQALRLQTSVPRLSEAVHGVPANGWDTGRRPGPQSRYTKLTFRVPSGKASATFVGHEMR